jgi:hypothetical protein
MNRREILEREKRGQRLAGFSAVAAAPLYIISVALDQSGSVPIAGLDTERYRAIHDASTQLLASTLLRSLAFAALVPPLLYTFRAAQARSERVNGAMVGFVFIGPILLAVQGIVTWIAQTQVASDFVSQAGPSGDVYTLLDDLIDNSSIFDVASNLLFPALLGLIVVMVYVPLQAMRAGLLSRFFATLGMALGVSSLFIVPALSLLALMIWFGWLGFTILDKVPKGRPPAWDAGEAIPWPKPGEQPTPAPAGAPAEVVDGDASEVFPESQQPTPDHSGRRERAKKRKRKRRR